MNICKLFLILCYYVTSSLSVEVDKGESNFIKWMSDAEYMNELGTGTPITDIFNPCPGHLTGQAGEAFTDLINTLILSGCMLSPPCTYPTSIGDFCGNKSIFDFIVVGAGTAGSAVAARLSEISSWNILLIEAGNDPTTTSEVPRFFNNLPRSDMDWDFVTIKETGLFNGLMGRVNRWPRGKVMGGTSTMSAMQYIRGDKRDYDNLAADGNVGWSYFDVLPYFKKSEDMRDLLVINQFTSYYYHGVGGPLTLSRFTHEPSLSKLILNAARDLGYHSNIDINGVNLLGFSSPNYGVIRGGERLNMARAFLNPIKNRRNLFVIKNAFVSRVLICPSTKRAYGVEYYYKNDRIPRTAQAAREVILSAGTVGSTKILLLSGVGPKAEIEDKGISAIQNLPVGRNLIDHLQFPGLPVLVDTKTFTDKTPLDFLDEAYEYLTRRTGPLSTIDLWDTIGFVSLDEDEYPDIKLHVMRGEINSSNDIEDFYKNIGLEEDIFLQVAAANVEKHMILPIPVMLQPYSRGSIKLKSSNPMDMPLINASYLSEPCDLETMLQSIRYIQKLLVTNPMVNVNATILQLQYPGCCNIAEDTDAYWSCAISHLAGTAHNQIGTNKMGPANDPSAVVDPMLKVRGIKGLRVADSSIIPTPITGGTLAIAVMIGEKAADMIKAQWVPNYVPVSATTPFSGVSQCKTQKPKKSN